MSSDPKDSDPSRNDPRPGAPSDSLTPGYFHYVYQQNDDPWNFETSPYEAGKFATTVASLPRAHYRSGFEVGCSIGVLTEKLAPRCDALLSVDVSEAALAKARQRCAALGDVTFQRMQLPSEGPDRNFDLIVVSEVAYYWNLADLDRAITLLASHHDPGGHLILVHWTPVVPDYPLTGDQVHDCWLRAPGYTHVSHLRKEQFRLDVLERRD